MRFCPFFIVFFRFGKKSVQEMFTEFIECDFRENRCSESHSSLRGLKMYACTYFSHLFFDLVCSSV